MLTKDFIDNMRQRLEEEKVRLNKELAGIPAHTEMGDGEYDLASEIQVDEVNHDLIARIKADLAKIDAALARIEAGTYGTDDDGNEISQERLEVLPWADKAI
jgi:RNA polymerase-binding transcription factor DksA